jgi:hypothetical protein
MHKWSADHLLPSLIYLALHPKFIVGLWGMKKKGKEETFYGSGLSRTGNVCIVPLNTTNGKQMQTLCYRALSTAFCTFSLLRNFLGNDQKNNWSVEMARA